MFKRGQNEQNFLQYTHNTLNGDHFVLLNLFYIYLACKYIVKNFEETLRRHIFYYFHSR